MERRLCRAIRQTTVCRTTKKIVAGGFGQVIDNNAEIHGMVSRLTHTTGLTVYSISSLRKAQMAAIIGNQSASFGRFGMACLSGANLAHIALQSIKGKAIQPPTIRYGLKVTEINTPVVLQEVE